MPFALAVPFAFEPVAAAIDEGEPLTLALPLTVPGPVWACGIPGGGVLEPGIEGAEVSLGAPTLLDVPDGAPDAGGDCASADRVTSVAATASSGASDARAGSERDVYERGGGRATADRISMMAPAGQ